MAKKRQNWEKKLYIGTAGSTAATQIIRRRNLQLVQAVEYGETTDGGDGTKIPHADRGPTKIDCTITFTMSVKDGDATIMTLLGAATNTTPTPLAIKYVDPVTGTVFDGDCYIKAQDAAGLGDSDAYDFECIPTTDGGREWLLGGL